MKDPITLEAEVNPRRAVVTIATAVVVVLGLVLLKPSVLGTVALILGFFVMIMLHELGHYWTAKRTGMKVTEFFVGFGPRIWSVTRGETEYGLKVFPLGGYCRIVGMTNLEEIEPEDEPRTYRSKSYPARVLVASAGSAVHFMLAFVLMFVALSFAGEATTTIGDVSAGQPAAAAGLRAGDELKSIAGDPISSWSDVPDAVIERGGETIDFVVERDGQLLTIPVTLATQTDQGVRRGFAGIGTQMQGNSVGEAAMETPGRVWEITTESVRGLGRMFSLDGISNYFSTLQGDEDARSEERFLSPVGFGRVANQAVNDDWVTALGLLVAINVFVGLFNLIPLLPFDGGHIAIATYERIATAVKGRRVQADVAKLMPLTVAVIAVMGFIFLSSLFLDISQPIKNPF